MSDRRDGAEGAAGHQIRRGAGRSLIVLGVSASSQLDVLPGTLRTYSRNIGEGARFARPAQACDGRRAPAHRPMYGLINGITFPHFVGYGRKVRSSQYVFLACYSFGLAVNGRRRRVEAVNFIQSVVVLDIGRTDDTSCSRSCTS